MSSQPVTGRKSSCRVIIIKRNHDKTQATRLPQLFSFELSSFCFAAPHHVGFVIESITIGLLPSLASFFEVFDIQ